VCHHLSVVCPGCLVHKTAPPSRFCATPPAWPIRCAGAGVPEEKLSRTSCTFVAGALVAAPSRSLFLTISEAMHICQSRCSHSTAH
jgi:hypothetical protein